jgi:HEAT repeat protein
MRIPFLLCMIPALLCAEDIEKSAWDVLNHALADGNPVKRSQALTALGLIGSTAPHVVDLLEAGLTDKDETVRQTAAVVMGEIGARQAIPMLKKALDDESGEVSFAAARSLWEMGDLSGREIFWAVLAGDQKTGPGMIQGEIRDAKRKMHSPAALAKIGISEAAGFLGPFSMGVGFVEDLMKDKGATARALSAKLLGSDSDPQTRIELEQSLEDKNSGVRAAAARALSQHGGKEEMAKIQPLLADGNDGVRTVAAAAIIRLSPPPPSHPQRKREKKVMAPKPGTTNPSSKNSPPA